MKIKTPSAFAKKLFGLMLLTIPALTFAADFAPPYDFKSLVDTIIRNILNPLMALLVAAAVVYFIWGVVQYINRGEDEGARREGANKMWYGIVGLFVIFSVWGLVGIVSGTFDLDNSQPTLPTLQ
jgi:hypothetical protein